jgi:hypothetical protein
VFLHNYHVPYKIVSISNEIKNLFNIYIYIYIYIYTHIY